jgi:prolyl-tRNA editing enzyme YbaK/EbsC (Cys-tRNA(Pro) deacylase)
MNATSAEQRVIETLEASGRPYEVISCDPAFADTAQFCAEYGYPLDRSANTIVVASKRPPGRFAACVVLATTRLDVNKRAKDHLGVRKLSFASPEVTEQTTGMMIGGVTPFALPSSIPLLIDDRIMMLDWVILGSGTRSSKIKTHPEVLRELPGAVVIKDLALPVSA